MTRVELESRTRKELAALAKRHQVPGWHPMKKAELVRALLKLLPAAESRRRRSGRRPATARVDGSSQTPRQSTAHKNGNGRRKKPAGLTRTRTVQGRGGSNGRSSAPAAAQVRDGLLLAPNPNGSRNGEQSDRLIVRVCTPHWLHAQWHLSRATIARAEAALGAEWHRAKPIIRVYDMTSDDAATNVKRWVRDVGVSGPTNSWCVPVDGPGHTYQLQIGYLAASGQFFILARSTPVRTETQGAFTKELGDCDLPGERDGRLPQRDGVNGTSRLINGVAGRSISQDWRFGADHAIGEGFASEDCELELNAELTVHGTTRPGCRVTLLGKRITVSDDGTFEVSLKLSDGRQVIPAAAVSPDGRETQTVVLAVEYKTTTLEPQIAGRDSAWS